MDTLNIAALLYALVIAGVIGFQCALIAGAPWGHLTQGGQQQGRLTRTGRVVAILSIVLLIGMGAAIVSAANLKPFLPIWTGWVALGIQILSTVLNWITPSRKERMLWGPITTLMSVLAIFVVTTTIR